MRPPSQRRRPRRTDGSVRDVLWPWGERPPGRAGVDGASYRGVPTRSVRKRTSSARPKAVRGQTPSGSGTPSTSAYRAYPSMPSDADAPSTTISPPSDRASVAAPGAARRNAVGAATAAPAGTATRCSSAATPSSPGRCWSVTDASRDPGFTRTTAGKEGSPRTVDGTTQALAVVELPAVAPASAANPSARRVATTGARSSIRTWTDDAPPVATG